MARTRAVRTARSPADLDRTLGSAVLDEVIGAALVLNAQLMIRFATPAASAALGIEVPIGVSGGMLASHTAQLPVACT